MDASNANDWEVPQEFYDLLNTLEQDELHQNVTQINSGKINPTIIKYQLVATDSITKIDKGVNTEPIIIFEPSDIDKLCGGSKLLAFSQIPQIYMSTATLSLALRPK